MTMPLFFLRIPKMTHPKKKKKKKNYKGPCERQSAVPMIEKKKKKEQWHSDWSVVIKPQSG